MAKQIRFNAFEMNCVGHQAPGLWTHPADRSSDYKSLRYWADLARLLEQGLFDGIFLADVLGTYDVFEGSNEAALRHAAQVPVNDPLQLIPAMAMVTEHLGFGLTASVSFEHPYTFARRLSTLDHLTEGRVGWNIVTSYLDSGARNIGAGSQRPKEERYDLAEEYMEVVYKLLEGSWEDGAVVRDRARGLFADPAKVHPIRHEGRFFTVPGIHLSEPSPQRTPLLFQAGSSPRGKRFAGQHAECVFVSAPSRPTLKATVAALRAQAAAAGRDPRALLVFNMQTVIVAETDAAAAAKLADYRAHVDHGAAQALLSGWMGVDFGAYRIDTPLREIPATSVAGAAAALAEVDGTKNWTVRDLCDWVGIGGFGPLHVGSPASVADELQAWVEDTDVDGFNLTYAVAPATFRDIVTHLVPELQRRGAYKRSYAPGTWREKLFGDGARLKAPHPASRYRDLAAHARSGETA